MKFGLIFALRNPAQWRTPWVEHYSQSLELIQWVEACGYDSVWLSEHHLTDDGYCPSVLATASAVAARTERIRIGSNILVLPLHHPLRVAEDAAVVDLISGGRLILGVGAGHRHEEFTALGVPRAQRGRLLQEGIKLMRECWTEGAHRLPGSGDGIAGDTVPFSPPPAQPGGPPIWIGARTEVATRRAGRIADGLILSRGRDQVRWFREAASEAGRDPDGLAMATIRIVHVAESREQARDIIGEHLLYHENSYREWFRTGDLRHEQGAEPYRSVEELPLDRYILGSPAECIAEIRRLEALYRFNHFIFWGRLPGLPLPEARRSLQLFAEEVAPALRDPLAPEIGRSTS